MDQAAAKVADHTLLQRHIHEQFLQYCALKLLLVTMIITKVKMKTVML